MRVDLEYLRHLKEELRKINRLDLKDIEWYEDGKKLEISDKIIDDFAFVGLNNEDFIDSEFYKKGWDEVIIYKKESE